MRRLLALALLLTPILPAHAEPPFDYYLLSLSIEPSFCAASPRNAAKPECRRPDPDAFRQAPLTLHGLWPNRARVSVNRQPQDCAGPQFHLSRQTADELRTAMPAGPGLARYEWRKHGTCSGLDPDVYFAAAARWTRTMNDLLAPALRDGGTVRLDRLLELLRAADPALGSAAIAFCRFRRGEPGALLEEVRVTLGRDLRPIPAGSVGLGQNSGCPGGEGLIPRPG